MNKTELLEIQTHLTNFATFLVKFEELPEIFVIGKLFRTKTYAKDKQGMSDFKESYERLISDPMITKVPTNVKEAYKYIITNF